MNTSTDKCSACGAEWTPTELGNACPACGGEGRPADGITSIMLAMLFVAGAYAAWVGDWAHVALAGLGVALLSYYHVGRPL